MTSTLKSDVLTSKTTDGDLTISGDGSGVPNLEAGFKVGGTVGVPVSALRAGTDGELITWDASGVAATVPVGTSTHVLTSNGTGAAPTFQAVAAGGPTLGTMLTPSTASALFSGIPAGTKRINISIDGLSMADPGWPGSIDYIRLKIGDAGGLEYGGYEGRICEVDTTDTRSNSHYGDFELEVGSAYTDKMYGTIFLTLMDATTFLWCCNWVLSRDPGGAVNIGSGTKNLSAELTQLEIYPQDGGGVTPSWDAGSINVAYD